MDDSKIVAAGYLKIVLRRIENYKRLTWIYFAGMLNSAVGVGVGLKFDWQPVSYIFVVLFAFYFFKNCRIDAVGHKISAS